MTILDFLGASYFWRIKSEHLHNIRLVRQYFLHLDEQVSNNEMDLSLVPLHDHPEFLLPCCELLNDEWKRSQTARLHSLAVSCDSLPTCLVMLQAGKLIGHAKLTKIPSIPTACFVESVVITRQLRRKGFGTKLMEKTEDYCRDTLKLDTVYLSTHDQVAFYSKLGYKECAPVSIYGGYFATRNGYQGGSSTLQVVHSRTNTAPFPIPVHPQEGTRTKKVYMKKELTESVSGNS